MVKCLRAVSEPKLVRSALKTAPRIIIIIIMVYSIHMPILVIDECCTEYLICMCISSNCRVISSVPLVSSHVIPSEMHFPSSCTLSDIHTHPFYRIKQDASHIIDLYWSSSTTIHSLTALHPPSIPLSTDSPRYHTECSQINILIHKQPPKPQPSKPRARPGRSSRVVQV